MYKVISNLMFFLVIIMIGITGYSIFSGKIELIPYIQVVFAAVLITWGVIEYKEDGKKTSYFYFSLAVLAILAAIYNFVGR